MEHDEMNDDTSSSAGATTESSTSAGPPEPPEPPAPPAEDSGPTLAGQVAAGLALVVLGGALLLLERFDGAPEHLFLILVGGVFAAGYFYRKTFGLLVPAGLLIGLGGSLALDDLYGGPFWDADGAAFGLGVGFLLIYVASLLYERVNRWWPLIPGGVLVVAGLPEFVWMEDVLDFWPVAVMAVGLFLLFRAVVARQKEGEARRVDP